MTREQQAIQESISAMAGRLHTLSTVRALENDPGRWRAHWSEWAQLGLLSIALPEKAGGAGCRLVEAAAALEQAAASLVPGPVLPTVLAGILLAGQEDPAAASLAGGVRTAAVALDAGPVTARSAGDGAL